MKQQDIHRCETEPQVRGVIETWYKRLCFPEVYDREFYEALDTIPIRDDVSVRTYDPNCPDGKRNLLSVLYLCEGLSRQYREKGIGEDILLDTLRDVVRWTENWSAVKGSLFLGELPWLSRHLQMKLFKLGRLQFFMAPAREDIPAYGIRQGDNVMEVHIPRGEKLSPEAVEDSFARAKVFFSKFYPEFSYSCYTCRSWLLEEKLREYLPEGSNILSFASRFDTVEAEPSDALLRFLFRWDTGLHNVESAVCRTELQRRIRAAVLAGEQFHVVLGVLPATEKEVG